MSVLTSRSDAAQNMEAAATLTALAPHLRRALRYQRRVLDEKTGALAHETGYTLMGAGLLVVGEGRRLKSVSDLAARLMDDDRGITASLDGRLRIASEELQSALDAMLDRRAEGGPPVIEAQLRHKVHVTRIILIRIVTDGLSALLEGPSVMVLIDPGPGEFHPGMLLALAETLRFTPAETDILSGILSGFSVEAIAARRGVSRETVRSQLKSLYAKTGARRQADLIRLLVERRYGRGPGSL